MSRPLRIEYPNAVYHITSRGNARDDIYLSDDDREAFLETLSIVVERFNWICHAYCLMSNHYHLMIETPNGNISRGMRHLNGVYTQQFNRLHHRVGHVFQGRFKSILIEKDAHLLELCRYIVQNPVAANMVHDVADWKWSSYLATASMIPKLGFLTTDWVLAQFSNQTQTYIEFVRKVSDKHSPLSKALKSNVLGSQLFREEMQEKLQANNSNETTRVQCHIAQDRLEDIRSSSTDRGEWMALAYRLHGYTMREIADYAQVHYSLVSKLIKAWEENNSTFKT